jgi:hypothetical protein
VAWLTSLPTFNNTTLIKLHFVITTLHDLYYCHSLQHFQNRYPYRIMSSSITIPSRSAYGQSSKAGSVSSYSSSPQTPQTSTQRANNATSPASASSTPTYGHDRRPSLLSESPLCRSCPCLFESLGLRRQEPSGVLTRQTMRYLPLTTVQARLSRSKNTRSSILETQMECHVWYVPEYHPKHA